MLLFLLCKMQAWHDGIHWDLLSISTAPTVFGWDCSNMKTALGYGAVALLLVLGPKFAAAACTGVPAAVTNNQWPNTCRNLTSGVCTGGEQHVSGTCGVWGGGGACGTTGGQGLVGEGGD